MLPQGYAESKPLLSTAVQLEDDIVAKPNYLSTMKNFALQQPSDDWMILEFSQLGFIGVPPPPHPTDLPRASQSRPPPPFCHHLSAPCPSPQHHALSCCKPLPRSDPAWSAQRNSWSAPTHPLHRGSLRSPSPFTPLCARLPAASPQGLL